MVKAAETAKASQQLFTVFGQHDAYSVARWMQEIDVAGTLPDYFQPHLQPAERTVALVEGWILGLR